MIGLGVLINRLGGNAESVSVFQAALGKKITEVSLNEGDNSLRIHLEDGSKIKLSDEGQSCCENRYMRTDDNLSEFVGAKLIGAELKEAPSLEDMYGVHEVQFLEIQTDRGVFTMASHNEHNGYYGGFSICVSAV